jgi:WD40 repeat protein
MLPEISNNNHQLTLTNYKSFAETLVEGHSFDLKFTRINLGTRFLYYDKTEHTLLISHVNSNRVHLLNLQTGKLRWFDHHGTTVRSVQTSNNHEIITASWDGTCCITDFYTLNLRLRLTEKEMGRNPYIAVTNNNEFVYSYSYDSDKNPERTSNTVRQWKVADGEMVRKFLMPGVHLTGRRCGSVEAYDEYNRLYIVSDTGHLHIYNATSGKLQKERFYNDLLQSLCIIPSLKMVALSGDNGEIHICDLFGRNITSVKGHAYYGSQLLVHPSKPEVLISVSHDCTIKLWNLSKLKKLFKPRLELLETIYGNRRDCLWSATVVNDLVLSGGDLGEIMIYDIKNPAKAEFRGKLEIKQDQFAFIDADSKKFYSTDLSLIQVRKTDGTPVYGQFADYLLKTTSDFKVFRDLFAEKQDELLSLTNQSKGFFQLTK